MTLSNSSLKRVLQPSVLVQLTLTDGTLHTFEVGPTGCTCGLVFLPLCARSRPVIEQRFCSRSWMERCLLMPFVSRGRGAYLPGEQGAVRAFETCGG